MKPVNIHPFHLIFFNKKCCDRCLETIGKDRGLSWFNDDILCGECIDKEQNLLEVIEMNGETRENYKQIGFIPHWDTIKKVVRVA